MFCQKVETNSHMRWCPVCTQKSAEKEVKVSPKGTKSKSASKNTKLIQKNKDFVTEEDVKELESQIIFTDGYMRVENGEIKENMSFLIEFKKKISSFFNRTNAYHGQCN